MDEKKCCVIGIRGASWNPIQDWGQLLYRCWTASSYLQRVIIYVHIHTTPTIQEDDDKPWVLWGSCHMTEPGSDIQFYNFWSCTKSKINVPEQYLSGSQPTSWAVGGEQEVVSARAGEPLHCCGCHHHQLTLTQWVRAAAIPKTLLMCTSLPKLSNQLRSFTTFSSLKTKLMLFDMLHPADCFSFQF